MTANEKRLLKQALRNCLDGEIEKAIILLQKLLVSSKAERITENG